MTELKAAGAEWVQINKPVLVLDIDLQFENQFNTAYTELSLVAPKILWTTYFSRLDANVNSAAKLPIAGLHIDLERGPTQLEPTIAAVKSTPLVLSLGLVSGCNIWKTDLTAAIKDGQITVDALGGDRVITATSSSLLHTPVTLAHEKKLGREKKDWFAFALEKATEVYIIGAILSESQDSAISNSLEANRTSIAKRCEFEHTSNDAARGSLLSPQICWIGKVPSLFVMRSRRRSSAYPSSPLPPSVPSPRPRRSVPLVPSWARKRSPKKSTRASLKGD